MQTGMVYFTPRHFLRGDPDLSTAIDVDDALQIIRASFYDGLDSLPCLAAADLNADAHVELTDAIYLLGYLFLGADAPLPPFPYAAPDPTLGGLGCEHYGPPRLETIPWR